MIRDPNRPNVQPTSTPSDGLAPQEITRDDLANLRMDLDRIGDGARSWGLWAKLTALLSPRR